MSDYTKQDWKDGTDGGTPITAARLAHIEDGIAGHAHSASDVTSGTLSADRLPTVPIAHGGTGATTAAAARANLGAASASDLATVRDSVSQATAYSFNKLPLGSAMKNGTVYCERLGRLVLLHFNGVIFATSHSVAENHDVVVCTGAPIPHNNSSAYMITSTSSEVRVMVGMNGNVFIHWASATAGVEYNGLIAYVAHLAS